MVEPRHIRLPFMDPLVLAIAEDLRAHDGNPDGLYKLETRRLGAPRAKAGDVMDVCEALVRADDLRSSKQKISYRADDQPLIDWKDAGEWMEWRWKVSTLAAMYCPTWAVRHRRRLIEVRREPLSAITDEGARNEGIARLGWAPTREGFLHGFRAGAIGGCGSGGHGVPVGSGGGGAWMIGCHGPLFAAACSASAAT